LKGLNADDGTRYFIGSSADGKTIYSKIGRYQPLHSKHNLTVRDYKQLNISIARLQHVRYILIYHECTSVFEIQKLRCRSRVTKRCSLNKIIRELFFMNHLVLGQLDKKCYILQKHSAGN
jgi:hypothetical protein